jgi:MFS family permease
MRLVDQIRLAHAPLAGFAAIGVCWGSFAAAVPGYKAALGIDEADLGLALFFGAAGAMTSMALSPRIMARTGVGPRTTAAMMAVVACAVATPGFAPAWLALAFALCAMGTTSGLLDVVVNARVSSLEARSGAHLMSLAHGLFSLAYAVAAFSTGLAREAGVPLPLISLGAAGAIVGLALLASRDPDRRAARPEPPSPEEAAARLPFSILWIGLLVLIAFFGENATEVWSALHVEQTLGGNAAQGALGPTLLGLTMAVGRLSGQALATRFGAARLMIGSALFGATGGMVAALAPTPLVAYLGFVGLGLGVSTLAPLGFALAGAQLTEAQRGRGIARVSLIGYSGFFIGPPLLGLVAEAFGLRVAFACVALMIGLIPLLIGAATRGTAPSPR